MATIYQDNGWWYVNYRIARRRVRQALKTKNPAVAKKKLRQLEAQMELGLLSDLGREPLHEAIETFLGHQARIRAPHTVKAQKRHLTGFQTFSGVKRIGDVKPLHVTAYLNSLDVAPDTRNQVRATLHRFFVWGMQEAQLVASNPVAMTKRAKEKVNPREFLTTEERDQVLEEVAEAELELPIALGVFAGLRREEIVRLEWRDVDLSSGFLVVREAKSNESRSVPIHRRLAELLEENRRKRGAVCREDGEAFHPHRLSARLKILGRQLEQSKLRGTHVLRHTFGTLCAQEGVDVNTIKGWMGHSALLVTQRYMHLAPGRRGKIDEI